MSLQPLLQIPLGTVWDITMILPLKRLGLAAASATSCDGSFAQACGQASVVLVISFRRRSHKGFRCVKGRPPRFMGIFFASVDRVRRRLTGVVLNPASQWLAQSCGFKVSKNKMKGCECESLTKLVEGVIETMKMWEREHRRLNWKAHEVLIYQVWMAVNRIAALRLRWIENCCYSVCCYSSAYLNWLPEPQQFNLWRSINNAYKTATVRCHHNNVLNS